VGSGDFPAPETMKETLEASFPNVRGDRAMAFIRKSYGPVMLVSSVTLRGGSCI
jgi:hypothetical protein